MLWPRHAPRESWCAAEHKPGARTHAREERRRLGGWQSLRTSVSIGSRISSATIGMSAINVEPPMTVQGLRPTKWPHL